ncbi:glycosyltransferase [Pelagibius sp.]|uniref:glycosyltransferase n=1 Tax=Pelagibius sp. TaxID=1931238 RepID=UPI00262FA5A1|nr:glycosyltransferase [Pelagibius sp.]
MKIAYVTMQFPVASETFAAVELRALQRLGETLSVLSYRAAPPGAEKTLAARQLADLDIDSGSATATLRGIWLALSRPRDAGFLVATVCRHCWNQPRHLAKALALVPRSLILLKSVERLKPDVLHLFWGHYPSLIGLLVHRRHPQIVVSQFLGAYDLERRFPLSGLLARQADCVVTHAKANLPAIAALGLESEDITVSYRGVEVPAPLPQPRKVRGLIAVAERLVPQKHTAEVVHIFAKLRGMMPEARLLILGDGPEAGNLKRLAADLGLGETVTFAGHVSHDAVFDHLARAEAVVTMSQSRSERLPNAIKEAMLHRCLCVTGRSPGIEELIKDGETGLLAEPGDIAGTAQRLGQVLSDDSAVSRIGAAAQARIVEGFNADRLMQQRRDVWSAKLATKSGHTA